MFEILSCVSYLVNSCCTTSTKQTLLFVWIIREYMQHGTSQYALALL